MPAFAWALVWALVQPIATYELSVELSPQISDFDVSTAKVVAVSENGSAVPLLVVRESGKARFTVGAGTTWHVTCESDGLWCPVIPVSSSPAGARIQLPVVRRALLRGEARAAHPAESPARLQVKGWGYVSDSRQTPPSNLPPGIPSAHSAVSGRHPGRRLDTDRRRAPRRTG
jgi:hypothetical protein